MLYPTCLLKRQNPACEGYWAGWLPAGCDFISYSKVLRFAVWNHIAAGCDFRSVDCCCCRRERDGCALISKSAPLFVVAVAVCAWLGPGRDGQGAEAHVSLCARSHERRVVVLTVPCRLKRYDVA